MSFFRCHAFPQTSMGVPWQHRPVAVGGACGRTWWHVWNVQLPSAPNHPPVNLSCWKSIAIKI